MKLRDLLRRGRDDRHLDLLERVAEQQLVEAVRSQRVAERRLDVLAARVAVGRREVNG